MLNRTSFRTPASRLFAGVVVLATASLGLAACAPAGPTGSSGGDGEEIGVSLIVKTTSNPFFVAMQDGAEAAAADAGV